MTNLAVSALVANSITQGAFNLNLKDFFFDDGSSEAINPTMGMRITARELISGLTGGSAGTSGVMKSTQYRASTSWGNSLGEQIRSNISDNWMQMAFGVVLIPVIAKTASKLIRKPVILPANRMLKSVGLDVKV